MSFQRGNSVYSSLRECIRENAEFTEWATKLIMEQKCALLFLYTLSLNVFQSSVFSFFTQLCSITAVCYLVHARFCSSNGTQQLHVHVKTNLLVGLIWAEIKTAPALLDFSPRSSVFLLGCLFTSNSIVWKRNFFLHGFNRKVNLLKNFNVSVNCHHIG